MSAPVNEQNGQVQAAFQSFLAYQQDWSWIKIDYAIKCALIVPIQP
ncbi:MAG: hypothetical protein ACJAZT_002078 [Gammaproteobacteria bacterium]